MSDNLTVFGTDFTGVTGIKAKQTGGSNLTYIRPTGTKSISANGTNIDVTNYASVDVAVPAQDSTFVITVSYNSTSEMWEPDCTWAEASAAYSAGKTFVAKAQSENNTSVCDCGVVLDDGDLDYIWFDVFAYMVNETYDVDDMVETIYVFNQSGITVDLTETAIFPQRINTVISTNGVHDVYRDRSVTVNVPTGTARTSSDLTVSGATVTAPAGLYSSAASASVASGTAGTPTATKGNVSNHSVSVTPSVTNTTGYITGGTKTGTAVTVQASELVSGTATISGSGTTDVTNYASASVAAGSATASATKSTVSNHAVTVTPSVTRTAGWVTAGSANGTAVTVSASELVSGSQTITTNDTYDVTNLASVVVEVQGGSTPDVQVATATAYTGANRYVGFTDLAGEPTSFVLMYTDSIATSSTPTVAAVVYDGNDVIGQTITNASNAQVSYNDSVFSMYYDEGDLSIIISDQSNIVFGGTYTSYELVYTYNGTAGNIQTDDVQVGSGATSITFTGLDDEPEYFSCLFKSNFSTSSGYQRVIGVVYDGTDVYGLEMDSSAKYSDAHWTYSYSSGSLTITSQGTNAGGYFHQPGYYQLTYAISGDQTLQTKTVTPTTSTQNVTADTAQGYTALKKVVVDPIPSQYVVPTGNIAITSNTATGQSLDVSQYATATVNVPTGGGSVNVGKTTWTNSSTSTVSHTFSNLSGTPKAAFLRCTAQLTRSSNNTYYYIADIFWDGTNAYGNYHLRSNGSFNNVASDAQSGFNVSVSGTSITFSSDATSRSSAPGAFYNGAYELTYVY